MLLQFCQWNQSQKTRRWRTESGCDCIEASSGPLQNQQLTGDRLEISEPPDYVPRAVLIFANVLDSPRAKQAYEEQAVPARETPASDSGIEMSTLGSKLSGEDEARYLDYRRRVDL